MTAALPATGCPATAAVQPRSRRLMAGGSDQGRHDRHRIEPAAAACAVLLLLMVPRAATAARWPWSLPDPAPQQPHPAVVRVIAQERDGIAAGSGTLVDVRDQFGLVVTNWHVVRDATGPVNVVFPDGFRSAARVLQVDRDWDLAALLIWRPSVTAVPLAPEAPRPGDALTIAGYGPGIYRAVAGRCTQYVAPSTHHPYEMVEVSTMAREGDSGGPIFNERGELAGVLFGSGGGTTAGSYAGRVREFLKSAWTPTQPAEYPQALAAAHPGPTAREGLRRLPPADTPAPAPAENVVQADDGAPADSFVQPDEVVQMQMVPLPEPAASRPPVPSDLVKTSPDTLLDPDLPAVQTAPLSWEEFAGQTVFQQVKTVLAIVGLAAIFLQLTRLSQPSS